MSRYKNKTKESHKTSPVLSLIVSNDFRILQKFNIKEKEVDYIRKNIYLSLLYNSTCESKEECNLVDTIEIFQQCFECKNWKKFKK